MSDERQRIFDRMSDEELELYLSLHELPRGVSINKWRIARLRRNVTKQIERERNGDFEEIAEAAPNLTAAESGTEIRDG